MPIERRAWRPAGVLAAALLFWGAPRAGALVGDTRGLGGLGASLRTIAAGIDNYDVPGASGGHEGDAVSQTLLRLTVAGEPLAALAYELHGVQSVEYSTAAAGAASTPFGLVASGTRYRALDATFDWIDESHHGASLWVDRANVRVRLGRADLTVGRQALSLGKAYFWNPLDVFLPFDPRQFDQEYKPGVDAARLDVALDAFSGVRLFAAAGRTRPSAADPRALDATWFGSGVLAQAFTTWHGVDLSVQGGKVYGGYQVGAGAAGEVASIETRFEIARQFARKSPPLLPGVLPESEKLVESGLQAVVGVGHRFESTLTLEAEYFQNGAGDAGDFDSALVRFANAGTLELSEHLAGGLASYEILPILTGAISTIVSFDARASAQLQPRITWAAANEIEVLAGGIVNFGSRPRGGDPFRPGLRSEFGSFPDVWYAEAKIYF